EILLCLHHRVDGLVRTGRLIDDARVLAALDAFRGARVIGEGEPPLCLVARHRAAGAVAAALEALRVALAAHDVGPRAHAPRNDAEVASARAHGALARHEDLATVVAFARH